MKTVLIMAGGTGGHVFPALAVATELQKQGVTVQWLGTPKGLENTVVSKANIPLHHIDISGWRRVGLLKWFVAPFLLLRAFLQAKKLIKTLNPDVVIGMGGFASGPGGLAARACHKPLIVLEQNSVPGLTNRVLARIANRVFEAFPESFPKSIHAVTIGNPVRKEIGNLPLPSERFSERTDKVRLLILGGSQGASILNEMMPKTLGLLNHDERPEIWHQTGIAQLQDTRSHYHIINMPARVDAFIENMAEAYAWADLVICRSGALTVTELMAVGLGSILIPFPYAVDDHQTHNANYLVNAHAAVLLPQKQLKPTHLAEVLHQLVNDRKNLLKMAEAARALYRPDATEQVVQYCLSILPAEKPQNNTETEILN